MATQTKGNTSMKSSIKNAALLSLALIGMNANALEIDSMLVSSDVNGNGVYTLTNNLDKPSFISASIKKVEVSNGELVKTAYTKDNLTDWEITLTTPKLILEPTRVKQVGVRSLCGQTCNFTEDKVYQITFSPVPYIETPDPDAPPSVDINFGYAPLFIIPAKESKVSYNMTYDGNTITVNNTGNTYIRFMAHGCESGHPEAGCRASFTSLAGRKRSYKLPENVQKNRIEVFVSNHDETYHKRLNFDKGQTQKIRN